MSYRRVTHDNLNYPTGITQVQECHPTVIPAAGYPAGEDNSAASICSAK
jgi:hypothetical protein